MPLSVLKLFSTSCPKKVDWGQKNKTKKTMACSWWQTILRDLVSTCTVVSDQSKIFYSFTTQICVFRCCLKSSCLKIQKQYRSEIPSSNPLLPLSNYSLAADKLQVCCVCLCLLIYNRWSRACVCWAGCQSLTGSARQVHITLPGTTKTFGEGSRNSPIFLYCPEHYIKGGRYFLYITENL